MGFGRYTILYPYVSAPMTGVIASIPKIREGNIDAVGGGKLQ